jgi:aarF domain-containing kinase
VQDAENALEVADQTAKEAEQRLAQALGGGQVPGRTERERRLEREARRTMDVAAERAEDLVAARKEADRVSLSQGSIERVHQRSAERLLALARRNRGVYLKLAQHLSQLDYLLPDEYTDTLRVCLDDAPQSSLADVAATVAEELGRPIEELFLSFEPLPLASASLAQVHRATVRDAAGGARSVAVKVQHRGLRETATGDVDMVTAAVAVVSRIFPAMPFWWVADEIAPNLPVELDFRAEAANARRCAAMFRGDPRVAVPETLPALSSSRVLTMSFEPGCSVADRAAIERMGLAPARVASLISEAFCFQVFEQGSAPLPRPAPARRVTERRAEPPQTPNPNPRNRAPPRRSPRRARAAQVRAL